MITQIFSEGRLNILKNIVEYLPEESFLREYVEAWPLAEPPVSFILYSAMAMLGSALGRNVYFDQDVHRTYPLLNLLLIGPSGIGKSTAIHMAEDMLIRSLPKDLEVYIVQGKSTKEALHDDLMQNSQSIVIASELSNMFSREKYNEGIIPYVTDLLDLRPSSVRTKAGGHKVIQEPSVSIIGGSTKEWLQDQMPSTAGAGGFLPRFLIVKEDYKGQRIADPRRVLSAARLRELELRRERLKIEFQRLVRSYRGVGSIDFSDYSASDCYGYWYQTYTPETGNLAPFAARAGVHVMRLALLVAISCEQADIRERDVEAAIKLYEYTHKKLQEVVVPMSPQGKLLAKVLECVGSGSVSQMFIRRAMRNYCSSLDADKMVTSLVDSGDLMMERDSSGLSFRRK